MEKTYIVIAAENNRCPECRQEFTDHNVPEHHANCSIGRLDHVVVDYTEVSPMVRRELK